MAATGFAAAATAAAEDPSQDEEVILALMRLCAEGRLLITRGEAIAFLSQANDRAKALAIASVRVYGYKVPGHIFDR